MCASISWSSDAVAERVFAQLGQRAFVGLTAMDRNSPSNYTKSTEANLADALAFIQYVRHALPLAL